MLWVLKRTVSLRQFFWAHKTCFKTNGLENIHNFMLKHCVYLDLCEYAHLSLCLLVSSAHNLCKQIGPRSGPTKCPAWSGSNLFDIQMVFLKEFSKKLILKKIGRRQKSMKNFPGGKELKYDLTHLWWNPFILCFQGCALQKLTTWLVCETPKLEFPNEDITTTSPKEVQYGFYLDGVRKFLNISVVLGPMLYFPDPVIEELPPKGDNAKKYQNGEVLLIKVRGYLLFGRQNQITHVQTKSDQTAPTRQCLLKHFMFRNQITETLEGGGAWYPMSF